MTLRIGSPFIRWFSGIGSADARAVGAKGASLGELDRAGLRVPPGFAVTAAAFDRMLALAEEEEPLRARIARLDANDRPGVRNACADIRERVEAAPLPAELRAVLVEAYRELCGRERDAAVAVRSSAFADSRADADFAGLLDTYLGVRGFEGVAHAVRSCWASLYSVDAVSYRLRMRVPETSISMGVVIQRMVNAHCSGVMLTGSPASPDRSVIVIEGSWGLGSCLGSGEVSPDRFVVSKVTGEIVKRTIADKINQHLPDAIAGGVRREPVPDELRSIPCLTDAQIAELAGIAKRIERHCGSAQDIEWAIALGERTACVLQSRAATERAGRTASVAPPREENAFDQVVSLLTGRRG